jgi:hypothetical protein
MASDYPWLRRVLRSSEQLPAPLPPTTLSNRSLRDHLRSQTSLTRVAALAPYPAADNVSAQGRWRGPGPPAHINSLLRSLDLCSPPLSLLHSGAAVVFPFLCVLSGKVFFSHSVDWKSVFVHGLCPRANCEVPITAPLPGTAWVTRCLNVNGAVFSTISSVAKPPRVVARTPLTSGRTCGTSCHTSRPLESACILCFMFTHFMRTRIVRTACPGSCIVSSSCRAVPAPVLMLSALFLPPLFSWLVLLWWTTLCLRARVCSRGGLVRHSLSALALPPVSRVAGRCPLPFLSARGAEAEAQSR